MQQQLSLIDKVIEKKLQNIIDEIKNGVLDDDEEIISEFEEIKKLSDPDQKAFLQYLNSQFRNSTFITEINTNFHYVDNQEPVEKIDFKKVYIELKEKKDWEEIIKLMKNQEFCLSNQIPDIMRENILLLQKLNELFLDLLDLIEDQVENKQPPQFKLLLKLLSFVYCSTLSYNEQSIFEDIIGQLMKNQIFQLQSYINAVQRRNPKMFEQFVQCIQNHQIQQQPLQYQDLQSETIRQQFPDKKLRVLAYILISDVRESRKVLDQYFSNLFDFKDKAITFQNLKEKLYSFSNTDVDFQECYFVLLWHYSISKALKSIFTDIQKQKYTLFDEQQKLFLDLKKVDPERKQKTIERFLNRAKKTEDDLHIYLCNRVMYFSLNPQDFLQQEDFSHFQNQLKNSMVHFQSYKVTTIEQLVNLPKSQFMTFLVELQQLQYMSLMDLNINDCNLQCLLLHLWAVDLNDDTFETLQQLFKSNQQNIFQLAYLLQQKIQSSQPFISGFLQILSKFHKWNTNHIQLFYLLLNHCGQFNKNTEELFDQMSIILNFQEKQRQSQEFKDKCFIIFQKDPLLYEKWLSPLYFNQYMVSSEYFKLEQIQKQYPQNLNTQLEDFNISLVERDEQEQEKLLKAWLTDMNDTQKFMNLIPFYFNIIKRQESSNYLITMIHNIKKTLPQDIGLNINMKALFQIFYNNANEELKVVLLKYYSLKNPVPLIYQNPNLNSIKKSEDLFEFNYNIYYIFQSSYTILNFSLSNTASQFGKTELINKIFYKFDEFKFQVNDRCQINNNTVDIMFDYNFNDTRYFTLADVHGALPQRMLGQILPLFKVWIVQMNTEDELEENFNNLKQFQRIIQFAKPKICFIIRNSNNNETENSKSLKIKIKESNIALHFIQPLKSDLLQATLQDEYDKASLFIFQEINKDYEKINTEKNAPENFMNQEDFLRISKTYNLENDKVKWQEIEKDNKIITELLSELSIIEKEKDGFFSESGFPIRSIEYKIKQQKQQLEQQTSLPEEEKSKIKNLIKELEKQINKQSPTKLLHLFASIFDSDNYYKLYVLFTDKIKQFNSLLIEIQQKNVKQNTLRVETQLQKNISIEIFWREFIQLQQKCVHTNFELNAVDLMFDLMKKGESTELLNGDELTVDHSFLTALANKFEKRGNEKILVFSILGPQSSGKSTMLNQMFGSHFLTGTGRCTKGIYLQVVKIYYKEQFQNLFDYILLLDTEGLSNPNQQDPEFDKKIALLVLQISDIIIVTVKGEIQKEFKDLLEMTVFSLKDKILQKQPSWCFNQNSEGNHQGLHKQIIDIAKNLNQEFRKTNSDSPDQDKLDYNEVLDIRQENIQILGISKLDKAWQCNRATGVFQQWKQQIFNETFAQDANKYGIKIIQVFMNKYSTQKSSQNINCFFKSFYEDWETIQKLPDIVEFTQLKEHKQNEYLKKEFEQKFSKVNFSFKTKIKKSIENDVAALKMKSLLEFKKIREAKNEEVAQNLNIVKQQMLEFLDTVKHSGEKIFKKIILKYQRILENRIKTEQSECEINIIDAVKQHERKFFEEKGFEEIESFLADLNSNSQEIQKYQSDQALTENKFKEFWTKIAKEQNNYQDKLFEEFQYNIYSMMTQASLEYSLRSSNDQNYYNFFKDQINQQNPIDNTNEKQMVFDIFKQELNQEQFVPINNNQYQKRFLDIFHQKIEDRLENENSQIISLSNFYSYSLTWNYISRADIETYFQSEFQKDLAQFIIKSQEKKNMKQIHNFVIILQQLQISYDEKQLNKLVNVILNTKLLYEQKQTLDQYLKLVNEEYLTLKSSFRFTKLKQLKQFLDFSHSLYPSMKIKCISEEVQLTNEVQYIKQQLLLQNVILKEIKEIKPKNDDVSFEYIVTQKYYQDDFLLNFPTKFNQIMQTNGWWKHIYYEVYDYIYKKMVAYNEAQYLKYLIQEIMDVIEQKIIEYNKQFSKFGLILRDLGARCIYYFSIFIIWRFTCFKKWMLLQENIIKFQEFSPLYNQQFKKFSAEINQNKAQQNQVRAERLVELIYKSIIDKFYEANKTMVQSQITQSQMTNQKLVQDLDKELLIEQVDRNDKEKMKNLIKYILHHKEYISDYVDNKLLQVQQQILEEQQIAVNIFVKEKLKIFLENTKTLHKLIGRQFIKTIEYFTDQSKNDEFYEKILFEIVFCCLKGKKTASLQLILPDYQQFFYIKQYQEESEIPLKFDQKNQDQFISSLLHFTAELKKRLEQCQKNLFEKKLEIDLSKWEVAKSLSEMSAQQKGCQESCPVCLRKCDQQSKDDKNNSVHKHFCQNGHYLRGMNGVLIEDAPSAYTCEEINFDTIITTQETKKERTWREIVKSYPDWDFQRLKPNSDELKIHKQKISKIWNGGVGLAVCKYFNEELNIKANFASKKLFSEKKSDPCHYIFMLDDSGSMGGQRWQNAKSGCVDFMNSIQNKILDALASVIIFNSNARVVIDCEKINIDYQHQLIEYKGGGTDFGAAFDLAFKQIQKYENKNIPIQLFFYTDGESSYPQGAINNFCGLPKQTLDLITIKLCTEADKAPVLEEMTNTLKKHVKRAEFKNSIPTTELEQAWSEIVSQNYHKLQ